MSAAVDRLNKRAERTIDLLEGSVSFIAFGGEVAVLVPEKEWARLTKPVPSQDELAAARYQAAQYKRIALHAIGAVSNGATRARLERDIDRVPDGTDGARHE